MVSNEDLAPGYVVPQEGVRMAFGLMIDRLATTLLVGVRIGYTLTQRELGIKRPAKPDFHCTPSATMRHFAQRHNRADRSRVASFVREGSGR